MKNSKKTKLKSIIGENNKFTKTISVVLLVASMLGLFVFIIMGLNRFGLIKYPGFIEKIFSKSDGDISEIKKDDGNIYDFLPNNTEPDETINGGYSLEITLENIRDIIYNINLPDNLYVETEAKYYDLATGTITRTEEMSLWKKGGKYKYILKENSLIKESYTNDSKTELIENFTTQSSSKKTVFTAFSFDDIPHIQNINRYLELIESGEIKNCYIDQTDDANTARIRYSIPQLNQREDIYISLDTGIVTEVKTYAGDNNDLFYECKTTVKEAYYSGDTRSSVNTSISDDLFIIE